MFFLSSSTSSKSASTTFSSPPAPPAAASAACARTAGPSAWLGLVHRLAQLHRGLRQSLGLGLDGFGVVAVHASRSSAIAVLDGGLVGARRPCRRVSFSGLLGGVDQRRRPGCGLDQLAALLVLGGVGLGFLDHLLDVGLGQAARGLDADLLFLAGGLVLGARR